MNPQEALVSVIIPQAGDLSALRRTLAAIVRRTTGPWELIVVDEGSKADVSAYWRGIADPATMPVTVVTGGGPGHPCGRGLEAARGDYLVLLRPGAIPPVGWIDQLIGLSNRSAEIGMVAPMSDDAPQSQKIDAGLGSEIDSDSLMEFASRLQREKAGRWFRANHLGGPCVLITRQALDQVGSPGDSSAPWPFEDDSWTSRFRKAGFTLAVARDLFVHRQADLPLAKKTRNRRFRISLTMIVRNEENNLQDCLASARGLFDEIVVVDTGSTDRTCKIALAHGARVYHFPWVDDFAAARNASLDHASGDYAFWLDADDRIESPQAERLVKLFDRLDRPDAAFLVRCACDAATNGSGGALVDHIRLFPLRADVRWCNRVHEQIIPALERVRISLHWSDVTIRHLGYVDPALRLRKLDRDRRLLQADLADRPGDPFILFNLGWGELERKDPKAALPYLQSSLSATAPTDAISRKLYALIALAYQKLGETSLALDTCCRGLGFSPGDPELLFREAILRRMTGDLTSAEARWREILEQPVPDRPFSSLAPGITGNLTRRNLAILVEEAGRLEEARQLWQEILAECPGDSQAQAAISRLTVS